MFVKRTAKRIELLLAAGLFAFAVLLATLLLRHHVLRELLSAVAQLVERALLVLTGASELAVREIVARLAHRLAGVVETLRHVDAVAAQALDDLVQPVAQVLLVSRHRAGRGSAGLSILTRLTGLTLLAQLTLALLTLLALCWPC